MRTVGPTSRAPPPKTLHNPGTCSHVHYRSSIRLDSNRRIGITGTILGNYIEILMDNRVGGFPFNLLRDHMYVGSMLCFAATALRCVDILLHDILVLGVFSTGSIHFAESTMRVVDIVIAR